MRPIYRAYVEKQERKPKDGDFTHRGRITGTDIVRAKGIYLNQYRIGKKWYEAGDFDIYALRLKEINPYSKKDSDQPDYSLTKKGMSLAEIRMNYLVFECSTRKIFPVLRTNGGYEKICERVLLGATMDFLIHKDFKIINIYKNKYSGIFTEYAYIIKKIP